MGSLRGVSPSFAGAEASMAGEANGEQCGLETKPSAPTINTLTASPARGALG